MHVGVCRFTILITASHSLKEKRMVLRRVKDRARERGVAIAEVGGQDTWQRGDLAFSLVAGEREHAHEGCERVLRQVAAIEGAQIAAAKIEVVGFGEDWYADAAASGRAWEAKTEGPSEDDLSWVPEEWRRDGE